MAGPSIQRKPTFFWQGLLILLPVAVLAVIGVISLRQDKILAQHDAAERAQVIADDLAAKIWNELTVKESSLLDPSNGPAFEVDPAGRLMFPPAFATNPVAKPFDPDELNADQKQLWLELRGADTSRQNSGQASRHFGISSVPIRQNGLRRRLVMTWAWRWRSRGKMWKPRRYLTGW